jgi:hypothetical protein
MDCTTEIEARTINGGNGIQTALVGPGTFLIQKCIARCLQIKEVCMQPSGATNLQLIEGGAPSANTVPPSSAQPVSANWSLQAGQPWSAPGKRISNDLYIIISAAVSVQVEVRYFVPECA